MGMPYILDMVHPNPGEGPTESWFNDPAHLAEWGFNGMVPHWHVQCAVTYDSFEKGIVPEGSEDRQWIEAKARQVDALLAEADAAGVGVYPFTDFLAVPRTLWAAHGQAMTVGSGGASQVTDRGIVVGMSGSEAQGRTPDIRQEMTRRVVTAQVHEVFDRFPTLAGLTLRFGETYLHDTPFHLGGPPVRRDSTGIPDHVMLANLLREEVCVKRGKMLFYRTWDFGDNFHVNPHYYLGVTDQVEPHPNLVFCIKHTRGDFWRSHAFNPTIGIGRHQQQIEVQCQREYEGKGAHPSYVAPGVINGFQEMPNFMDVSRPCGLRDVAGRPTTVGLQIWSRGGGWEGPYIKHEFWVALNTYVMARWAQAPERAEEDIFNEFARMHGFEGEDLTRLRKICTLADRGVLLGQMSSASKPHPLWTRDEYIGLPSPEDVTPRALAEKTEAVRIWRAIEKLADQIDIADKDLQAFIATSAVYGRIKFEVIECVWRLVDMAGQDAPDREALAEVIARYDRLWDEWAELARQPWCSTIYSRGKIERSASEPTEPLVDRLRPLI